MSYIFTCEDCKQEIIKRRKCKNIYNLELCSKCLIKRRSRGGELRRSRYDEQVIEIKDNYAEILLYDICGNEKARALIDINDAKSVSKHKWYLDSVGYVRTTLNDNVKIRLHRFLLNPPEDKVVDHINENRLDNRRENLRIIEHLDNVRRSHKKEGEIVGVYKTVNNTYYSHLDYNSKTYNKNFKTFEEAKLYRYILELNYCREFSPQIDLIKNEYPHLLKVLDLPNMKINEDIKRVKEVLLELKLDSHCPCMIVKNKNTICPCLPCRNKNICICELFKNINVEESEVK